MCVCDRWLWSFYEPRCRKEVVGLLICLAVEGSNVCFSCTDVIDMKDFISVKGLEKLHDGSCTFQTSLWKKVHKNVDAQFYSGNHLQTNLRLSSWSANREARQLLTDRFIQAVANN